MTKNVFWGLDFYLGGYLFSSQLSRIFFWAEGHVISGKLGILSLIFPYLGGVSVIYPKYKNQGDIYKNILNIWKYLKSILTSNFGVFFFNFFSQHHSPPFLLPSFQTLESLIPLASLLVSSAPTSTSLQSST